MDYAEPLIKAKQTLKEYEQAVLSKNYLLAMDLIRPIREACGDLYDFAKRERSAELDRQLNEFRNDSKS